MKYSSARQAAEVRDRLRADGFPFTLRVVKVTRKPKAKPQRWGVRVNGNSWCRLLDMGTVANKVFAVRAEADAEAEWLSAAFPANTYEVRPYPGPVTITEMPKLAALEAWLKALGRMAEAILCDDPIGAQFQLGRAMGR